MSFQHHEGPREDRRLRELFDQQQKGEAPRQWPNGRIAASDDGEIACMVGGDPDKQLVAIEFPKAVRFVAMPPQDAIELAKLLIKQARAISKEPLQIVLH